MNPHRRPTRLGMGLLAAGLAAGGLAGQPAQSGAAAPPPPAPGAGAAAQRAAAPPKDVPVDTLEPRDMQLLAEAEAARTPHVDLVVATDKGRTGEVAAALGRLGARIATRSDALGYLRVRVATKQTVRAAAVPGITAVDLNERLTDREPPRPAPPRGVSPRRGGVPNRPSPQVPGPTTKAANPFLPAHEMGAVSFRAAHPAWDGRGITIGVLDSGVALDHPALAQTSTGQRKIVDWFTATAPLVDDDGTWLAMVNTVSGPAFTIGGATWTAPAGTYRFQLFREARTDGGEHAGDVNRDGDKTDVFGVLYHPDTHDVWVDTDGDHDFTDSPAMRPYKERFQIGYFGTDRPDTAVSDRMPFVVEYREDVDTAPAGRPGVADFVSIGIADGSHGSHVAGIAAGNDLLGNSAFDGVAPGAQIVSARGCIFAGGCTAAALTDGLVALVTQRKVDIVNLSIGGLPPLNDGANARAALYNRVVTDYGVQLVISASNSGPGLNTIGDPGVVDKVITVGASVSKATWRANYGSVVQTAQGMFSFSSRGPREDGGFKPEVVAPGSAISTTPPWQNGGPVAEAGYPLPPGYAMFNGTSMSAPQATGAAALLLSAARAQGVAVTPLTLRRAVYGTAKPLPGEPTYVQGHGMVSVPDAWKQLRSGPQAREYTVDAPVCTPLSGQLTRPHRGAGLYNRCAPAAGGHHPGQSRDYTVTVTRTTGPAGDVPHTLTWKGNDGTFSAPASVRLPLGTPTQVPVTAKPSAGVHSAILVVDDPATPLRDAEVSTVVTAPHRTLAAPDFRHEVAGTVQRNAVRSYLIDVPAGTATLELHLSKIATGSHTRFLAINPYGVPVENVASTHCFTNHSDPALCAPIRRSYADPLPGLWEVTVESRRTSPVLDNPYALVATALGVAVSPDPLTVPDAPAGTDVPVEWSLRNAFAPATVTAKAAALGSVRRQRPTIAEGAAHRYTVDVPAGAQRFTATIGGAADIGADLDLKVERDGAVVGQSADGDAEESVTLTNPEPGRYTVVVDGYEVPTGTTAYDYLDAFYAPALGMLRPAATTLELAHGASAKLTGTLRAAGDPGEGRTLSGELQLVTDVGTVVGRGSVVVGPPA